MLTPIQEKLPQLASVSKAGLEPYAISSRALPFLANTEGSVWFRLMETTASARKVFLERGARTVSSHSRLSLSMGLHSVFQGRVWARKDTVVVTDLALPRTSVRATMDIPHWGRTDVS